jgi:hypothetical protein
LALTKSEELVKSISPFVWANRTDEIVTMPVSRISLTDFMIGV